MILEGVFVFGIDKLDEFWVYWKKFVLLILVEEGYF